MLRAENLLTAQTKDAPILYISSFAGFNKWVSTSKGPSFTACVRYITI